MALRFLILIGLLWSPGLLGAQKAEDPVKAKVVEAANGNLELWAENSAIIPMQLQINFPKLENMEADADLPYKKILAPGTPRQVLLTLRKVDPKKGWRYSFEYLYMPGDPSQEPDLDYLYGLPFEHGTKHRVGQGYFGTFSHSEDYALDFDMDEGTKILAARGGLVFEVKQDSNVGGVGEYYRDKGNYVKVLHDDGTMATYVHLKLKGAAVKVGDTVEAGDLIGYSGNTGYSSGPHLHFEVSRPRDFLVPQSIPTKFRGLDDTPLELKEGQWIYGVWPGKPAFEPVFGSDWTHQKFAGWDKKAAPGTKLTVRKETLDDTSALFLANPTASDMDIEFKVQGSNLWTSVPSPQKFKIKSGRELFIMLLRPAKPGAWKYSYSYSYLPLN